MDGFGFIRERLDIKILILFILIRLPEAIEGETLADLVLCNDEISYFDYSDCLAELIQTGHVEESDGKYRITEKGERNGSIIENSLPYSVRSKTERAVSKIAAGMRRDAMIRTYNETDDNGGVHVTLSLSDGIGELAHLRLLVNDEAQAEKLEKRFRCNAEYIYNSIMQILTAD